MKNHTMGIDIGTTSTKTILIDENGNVIASATEDYPLDVPKAGWAEQKPEDWYEATTNTIKKVIGKSNTNPEDIKAIGLSGQMHGSVFLDKDGGVIRPAILWCDQRTEKQCREIYGIFGYKNFIKLSFNKALPGFTAPKILWLRENEPENYKKVAQILLPKDYVRFMLSGIFATEVSDAAGTVMLDIAKRDWSDEILEGLSIDRQLLPPVHESPVISSKISKKTADLTGLLEGTPIVGGASDNAAGAIGSGIIREGLVSDSIGTSGVVFASSDKPSYDPEGRVHAFCHAVPGKWHFTGVTLSAAGSLKWYYEGFGPNEEFKRKYPDKKGYELLNKQAESVEPGSESLIFLPYLSGERTPHGDPYARGVFFGISYRHTQDHFVRAIMEGVSFSQLDCLEIIKEQNIEADKVIMFGGGAKSKVWRQILADILDTRIVTLNIEEGPAYGAALLAGVGAGIYEDVETACSRTIKEVSENNPLPENLSRYKEVYDVYKSLYSSLKQEYRKLEGIS
ncbi:MAG: xylulokinase [Actinomycetota bacterium]